MNHNTTKPRHPSGKATTYERRCSTRGCQGQPLVNGPAKGECIQCFARKQKGKMTA